MSAIPLTELRTEFENLKGDISDVSVRVFISWCNRVMNFVWRKLREQDPDRFFVTQEFSVTSEVQTDSLPTNFSKFDALGCGFYQVNNGVVSSVQLTKTGKGSQQKGYYFDGGNIVFTQAQNATYVMRYLPKQPKFTVMEDYFTLDKLVTGVIIIDDEFMDYLVQAIDVRYAQWDEDTPSEANADQRFINVLNELLEEFERDSAAVGIESPYGDFGGGNSNSFNNY